LPGKQAQHTNDFVFTPYSAPKGSK